MRDEKTAARWLSQPFSVTCEWRASGNHQHEGGGGDLGSEGGVLRNERDHLWNVPCLNLLTWAVGGDVTKDLWKTLFQDVVDFCLTLFWFLTLLSSVAFNPFEFCGHCGLRSAPGLRVLLPAALCAVCFVQVLLSLTVLTVHYPDVTCCFEKKEKKKKKSYCCSWCMSLIVLAPLKMFCQGSVTSLISHGTGHLQQMFHSL